jgi:hypothetical protein
MSQRKTYFLDLQTLLPYLNDQSCELTTTLKASGKPAKGTILLKDGKIVSCLLQFQNGSQIGGAQAYKQLEACTQWQVELAEEKEKLSHSGPLSAQPRYFSPLRQKRPLDLALLQDLPMRERLIVHSVFTTVNGRRNSEEIKAQLHFSPRDVDEALARLRLLGLIE